MGEGEHFGAGRNRLVVENVKGIDLEDRRLREGC